MSDGIVIAQAKRSDAPAIARLLDEWLTLSAIRWPAPEPNALVEWVLHTLDTGYVVTAQADGRLLGVAGIQPCYLPWNIEEPIMRDAFFYVPRARSQSPHKAAQERVRHAARRTPGVANGLMDAIKLYCAKRGKPLVMEIVSGIETDKLERWYSIRGGRYAGGTMVFGLEG